MNFLVYIKRSCPIRLSLSSTILKLLIRTADCELLALSATMKPIST
jgi:hypothetical protein